jgi:hypothetical protein
LSNPASGWIASALGILITVYFYFNPRKIIGRIRYKVLDADSEKARSVFRSRPFDAKMIYVDVWNPSRNTLDASATWEPLTISFPEHVKVVEASIDRAAQSNSESFSITGVDSNAIQVCWKYMDYGTAVRVLISTAQTQASSLDAEQRIRGYIGARSGAIKVSARFKDFILEDPFSF